MQIKIPPCSDALYKIHSKIILVLGLTLLLLVNCLFYYDFKDQVKNGISNVNKQLDIQKELLDEGMSLMFNSVYLQRSWIQDKLNDSSDYYRKDSLIDKLAYDPVSNISSLDGHMPEDEYSYGNFFIPQDVKKLDPETLKKIELMQGIFDLQRFLKENSFFSTWSTYYTRDYITIYPFGKSEENIKNASELFTSINQAIDQLNNEKNREVFKKGWETDIFLDHTGNMLMFSKNLPVLKGDEVAGIIAVNISVDDIQNYIKKSDELEVYLADADNNVVYCNGNKIEKIQNLQAIFKDQYKLNDLEEILKEDISPKMNGRYFLSTKLQNAQWKLIYVVPESMIENSMPQKYFVYALTNLFFIVGIALIYMLFSKYNKKAMEIARLKDEFLMTVSHDLKSPLASMIGFSEMIINKLEGIIFPAVNKEDEKIDKAVKRIRRNSSIIEKEGLRLTEFINKLLDLSVLENGELFLNKQPGQVRQMLEDSFEAVQALIKSKGLDYFIEVEDNIPQILADREKIIQLLVNLLSNAVKFTEEGYIKCSARAEKDRVVFCVEDTGIGIAKKYQDNIFDKFIKAEENGRTQKGTGLGLAICKNIVNKHGGNIWLESEEGRGSKFFFELLAYKK